MESILWMLNPAWIYLEIGLIVMGVMAIVSGIILVFLPSELKATQT